MNIARTALGFLVAPAILPLATFAVIASTEGEWRGGVAYASILCPFVYGTALVLGIPTLAWFRRKGWNSAGHYALAGAVFGLLPLFVLTRWGQIALVIPPIFSSIGAVSALVFWLIAVRPVRPPHAA